MSKDKSIISPIAIDLGAKNTGVYFAHYPENISSLSDKRFEKSGKVYQLEEKSYTLLMANRTAKRHQKRGYDRRQMAKRLFKLIWEKHFKFPWDKDVQQTISFLLNRRGFTFLKEEYNPDELSWFPKQAYNLLPKTFLEEIEEKDISEDTTNETVNFDIALKEWAQNQETIKKLYQALETKISLEELRSLCEKLEKGNYKFKKNNLSGVDKEIWENIKNWGVKGLDDLSGKYTYEKKNEPKEASFIYDNGNKVNISAYLEHHSDRLSKIQEIKNSLPSLSEEEKKLKKSIWDFNPEKFDLEKEDFGLSDDGKENMKNNKNLRTHIYHLAFALYKTHTELESGGRYRSKYFEEVKDVLECKNHAHGYLKRFCSKLHSGHFKVKKENQEESLKCEDLTHLIGHISNFELKPLRKYFNDEKHKIGDYWNEVILTEKFKNWFKKEWRVNLEKDKHKAKNKRGDYQKLKKEWEKWEEKNKGRVVNFWLKTDPFLTIPPYQDNNNRRPPKCQSLILNPEYLNEHYPDWEKWLEDLESLVKDYLCDYETQLTDLKSSSIWKKNSSFLQEGKINGYTYSYFSQKDSESKKDSDKTKNYRRNQQYLKARVLQFIFDRAKNDDPLKLNEIYSHTKKYRQNHSENKNNSQGIDSISIKEKIEKAVKNSKLPEKLKTKRDYKNKALFAECTFLHLVCNYYKLRKRARDGRIFIQPKYRYVKDQGYKNTGRFYDKNYLLTYCNYKPRQKRYQMLEDLASLLQVPSKKLKEYVDNPLKSADDRSSVPQNQSERKNSNQKKSKDEKLFDWLGEIKGLKTNCTNATKEQQNRRGRLKLDIQRIYGFIYHETKNKQLPENKNKRDKEVKKILKRSKVDKPFEIWKFCENSKERCLKITDDLYSKSEQEKWEKSLKRNPANAVYFLSQIDNIVFKERNGNAKTCAVCSVDNAQRMQYSSFEQTNSHQVKDSYMGTKAQRLPAIPTRLIDGAVMRMARIVGSAIADEKWRAIQPELEKGLEVCVPIITESNQFEFEPSKEDLVKKQRIVKGKKGGVLKRGGDIEIFKEKNDRIKDSNPKNICPYTGNEINGEGHIDHIIPRSGKKGILNDEANLIWTSEEGNQHKSNHELSLKQLNSKYKKSVFGEKNNEEIQNWIIEQIGNDEEEEFKFGKYHNFMSLEPDERTAFRHALFLVGHPVREKVIKAIDNRNRALVNGTQRYFAEVLANKLYKKILYWNRENKDKAIKIHNLSFDYFGVSSTGEAGSVPFIRKFLENKKNELGNLIYPELLENRKPQNEEQNNSDQSKKKADKNRSTQTAYSHLIDAQVAFMIALNQHCKEGTFKVNIEEIDPYSDKLYSQIRVVEEKNFEEELLKRQLPSPGDMTASHRPLFNENAVAMHFLKLIEIENNGSKDYLSGFLDLKTLKECLKQDNWKNCIGTKSSNNGKKDNKYEYAKLLRPKKVEDLKKLYNHFSCKKVDWPKTVIDREQLGDHQWTVRLHQIDKQKVYEFLMKNFNTKINPEEWDKEDCEVFDQLKDLWYFTKRENVIKVVKNKNQFNMPKEDKFKCARVKNPHLKSAWDALNEKIDPSEDILLQVKEYFLKNRDKKRHDHSHQKTRKVFSLPVGSQRGFLIKKKSWQNQIVFYFRPASNDFSQTILPKDENGQLLKKEDKRLSNIYRKSNIVYIANNIKQLKKLMKSVYPDLAIDPNKWYPAEIPEAFKKYINKIENRRTDEERPQFRFELSSEKMTFEAFKEFINEYPFRKLQDLKAEYRKKHIMNLKSEEQLKKKIEEVQKQDPQPQNLLSTLKAFDQLWEKSQATNVLTYQARAQFTLSKLA